VCPQGLNWEEGARGGVLPVAITAFPEAVLYIDVVPLREKSLIAGIRRQAKRRPGTGHVLKGIGDDCAILRIPAGHDSLVTTDFSLEGVHFRRDWHPPESVGHRCLARGLSDIAAMGGKPVAAFLSLALPTDLSQAWVDGFLRGLLKLAQKYGVTLAGGDTAESPDGILADIIVVGAVPRGKAVLRSGARPGDRIFVSGQLGGSAAAVVAMDKETEVRHPEWSRSSGEARDLAQSTLKGYPRHFHPDPRLELGQVLRKKRLASAMIDLSDGLSADLNHICEESGVGADLASELIPRARVGKPAHEVSLELALHGGEDYELVFTVPPGKRVPARVGGVTITEIGVIMRSRGIFLRDEKGRPSPLAAHGWEHFRR